MIDGINIVSTHIYQEIPFIFSLGMVFYACAIIGGVLLFSIFCVSSFQNNAYILGIIFCIIAFVIVGSGIFGAEKIQSHFSYKEYIVTIEDNVSFNDIANKYYITQQKDGTFLLRPIERERAND